MRRLFLRLLIITMFVSGGCQSDSDYTLGTYTVNITVQTSTCPTHTSFSLADYILPTSFVPGQTALRQWKIERVAITSTGTEKIHLLMNATETSDSDLMLSGTLDQDFFRFMEQKDVQIQKHNIYRTILLSGRLEQNQIFGQLDTFLSESQESISIPYFPAPEAPCQVTEHFLGVLYPSE